MRKYLRLLAVLTTLGLLGAACGDGDGDDDGAAGEGGSVTMLAKWTGTELENAEKVMAAFTAETGIDVQLEGVGDNLPTILSTRVEGGNPPDLAQLPQPGLLQDLAERGALQPIDDVVGDAIDENYAPHWREFGSYNDTLYGLWFKVANKSTVWYDVPAVADAGLEPPETYEEWVTLAGDLKDAGVTPLAVGGADGWVLSDWFENVFLRVGGAEKYQQLIDHEIPWTDQSVKDTFARMQELIGEEDNVAGGLDGALQTGFQDSVKQVFAQGEAAMLFEGDFVAGEIINETDAEPGTGFDFFAFPSIGGSPPAVVGGGDVVVMLNETDEATRLLEYLATPEAAEIWAAEGGFTSANTAVDVSVYPDDITRRAAQQLLDADEFVFDLSDSVPSGLGATAGSGIWGRLQDWMANPSDIDGITARLEEEAQAAYA
jgi:ABC-type glycerol-3-phosphate transport system substrate-binding protein